MGKPEFGGQSLPRAANPARSVGLSGNPVQDVKQPVSRVRERKALSSRSLGNEPNCEVGGDAPRQFGVRRNRSPQRDRAVDVHRAGRDGHGIAVMPLLEQRSLREGGSGIGAMQNRPPPLGGRPHQLQHAGAYQDEPDRSITRAKQRLVPNKVSLAGGWQESMETWVHR